MKLSRMIAVAIVVLGTAVGATTATAGAAAASARGQGSGIYLHPPFTGDRVAIALDASGSGGRFEVVHFDKFGEVFARLSGTVDCVAVDGRTAFTTGTITAGFAPEIVGDVTGKSFAITVLDNGDSPDLAGVSYPLDGIPPCSAWPLNVVMDQGTYTTS